MAESAATAITTAAATPMPTPTAPQQGVGDRRQSQEERDVSEQQGDDGHDGDEDHDGQRDVSMSEEPNEATAPDDRTPKKRTRRQFPGRNLPKTSCMRCKLKKMRCEASENQERICKRCEKGRHECQYQVPDQRLRSSKLTRRIEYLEQSIDHLKNVVPGDAASQNLGGPLLVGDDTNPNWSRIDRLEQTLLHYTAELERQKVQDPSANRGGVATYALNPPQHLPPPPPPPPPLPPPLSYGHLRDSDTAGNYRDVIDQGIFDLRYAGVLLSEFKAMSQNFPYLIIPPGTSVNMMRRDSPMLLLAIFACASWRDRELQMILEKMYLRVLAGRMVVEAEQSLDMLQGLLVHLSWCHFHLKSSYRLAAYASSIVVTMGLNKRPNHKGRQTLGVNIVFPLGTRPPSLNAEGWSSEARRAYIGCYVICSSYSHALRKVGTLKYTPYLEECALTLRRESSLPSDEILIHFVRLIHHAENVCDTFDYDSTHSVPHIPEEQLQFYVRSFNATLDSITTQIPAFLAKNTMLATYILLVSAYTHEIGLHGLSAQPTTLSIPRTTILIDCLGAVKKVLDTVANLSDADFRSLLGFNWARVHYTLNLAIELSLGIESPSWSLESVRGIVALESYIDIFVKRLELHSDMVSKKHGDGDWFSFLAAQWAGLRRNYVEGMRRRGVGMVGEEQRVVGFEGWMGLGEMDFMPSEWFWMTQEGGM